MLLIFFFLAILTSILGRQCQLLNLCKTAILEKTENWFSNTNYRLMQVKKIAESAILSTCIKLPFVIKIFVLSIFEWPFYTGFTVLTMLWVGLLSVLVVILACFFFRTNLSTKLFAGQIPKNKAFIGFSYLCLKVIVYMLWILRKK